MAETLTFMIVLPDGREAALERRDDLIHLLSEVGLRLVMTSDGTDVILLDDSLTADSPIPLLGLIRALAAPWQPAPVHEKYEPGCGYPADSDPEADPEEDDPETATCAVCLQVITRKRCAAGGIHWTIPGAAWPGRCGKVPGTPHRPGPIKT